MSLKWSPAWSKSFVCLLVLQALAAGCANRPGATAIAPLPSENLEVREVPTAVGGFRRTDVHRFPDAAMGVAYRFRDNSVLQPDVYHYPRDVEGPVSTTELLQQGRQLIRILPMQRAAGRFNTYEVLADSILVVALPGGTLRGSHVELLLTRQEQRASHQHVFALGSEFVKIRTSFPPAEETTARLEEFIEDLLAALVDSPR